MFPALNDLARNTLCMMSTSAASEQVSSAVLPNQWVVTHQWVTKLFQVGREAFLNVTVFY